MYAVTHFVSYFLPYHRITISSPRHKHVRLTTNVLLRREKIPSINRVSVDQVTVFVQKKKEGGFGIMAGSGGG